jgi:hypothetical protein
MKSNHTPPCPETDSSSTTGQTVPGQNGNVAPLARFKRQTEFGRQVGFLENQFVSAVLSQRAGGLSIEANINPGLRNRRGCLAKAGPEESRRDRQSDLETVLSELEETLSVFCTGRLRDQPWGRKLSGELLKLHHVALTGDSEPTSSPTFFAAVEAMTHIRASGRFPFFKMMLNTNASRWDERQVQPALKLFTRSDEIWIKLNAGTQYYLNLVARLSVPLENILQNILSIACQRPVIIQSMFPEIQGEEPPLEEIMYYVQRLKELKDRGAQISLVQIYSAHQPMAAGFGHLSLKILSFIAQSVRNLAGLRAEVY